MKFLRFIFILLIFVGSLAAQNAPEILHFKSRVGFENSDEKIVAQKFFDGDEKLVLIGKKSIQFWDVKDEKLLKTVPHEIPNLDRFDTIRSISPDGQKLVVFDEFSLRLIGKEKNVSASVWDLQNGKRIAVLERPTEPIRFADWSANGKTLITYSGIDNLKRTEVSFWDGLTFTLRGVVTLEGNFEFRYLTSDGSRLITARTIYRKILSKTVNLKTFITIWDAKTAKIERELKAGNEIFGVRYNAVSPDEKLFAADAAGKISVWKIDDGNFPIYEIAPPGKDGSLIFNRFSDDSRYIAAEQKNSIDFYATDTGKLETSLPDIKRPWLKSVGFSPDSQMAWLDDCSKASFFDLPTGRKLYDLKLVCKSDPTDIISTDYRDFDILRFHPDGKLLLAFSDKTVRVLNGQTGEILQTLAAPERVAANKKDKNKDDGLSRSAGWLMNGKYLFVNGADGKSILLWKTGENI